MAEQPVPAPAEAPAADGGGPAKKGGGPVPLLLVVILLGQAAMGGFMFMSKRGNAAPAKAEAKEADDDDFDDLDDGEVVSWPLATKTTNLADGNRYARYSLALAYQLDPTDAARFIEVVAAQHDGAGAPPEGEGHGGKKSKKGPSKKVTKLLYLLSTQASAIDNAILEEISDRKYQDLLSNEDRAKLKKAVMARLDELLTDSRLKMHDIYFSEFVMQ